MAFDYNKFITPFYEIEISDPQNKRKVKLPHHILRLVDKIEINEAYASPENEIGATTATISLIEGSREPASQDPSMGTSGLYKMSVDGENTDMAVSGSITNRVGSIVDLRFSGTSGITFLSESEKRTGVVDSKLQENVDGKVVSRKHKGEPKPPKFLFDAYNKVKITWGYKEDPGSVRSIMLNIINVETIFSDSGPTTVNVLCSDHGPMLNQITPKVAKVFGKVRTFKGDALVEFEDLKTDDMIRKIASDAGMATIISKNLPSDVLDKGKQKMWIAGESFHQFMSKLAAMHNSYYKVINDPKTGKATLLFIKREDFEARTVLPSSKSFYLEYKHPGSIIKRVTVNADYAAPNGFATTATDDSGDKVSVDEQVPLQQFKKDNEQYLDSDPTKDPAVKGVADFVLGGDYTGNVEHTPNQSLDYHKGLAKTRADKVSRIVAINVDTLGYTKLTPGVFNIANIGVRYSGKYRMMNVTHIIDSSGYICRMSGMTHSLPQGGVKVPDAAPAQEKPEEKVELQQFADAKVRDQLDKFQGTS